MDDSKEHEDYELQCDCDTIIKAHEIMADPERMAKIAPLLAKKKEVLSQIPVKSMKDLKARKDMIDKEED